MATKKKGKGKKSGVSAKDSKDKKEPVNATQWDDLDKETLDEITQEMERSLEKLKNDRNYAQVESNSLQEFYNVTQQEIKYVDLKLDTLDQNTEALEEDHQVEILVYQHKVKHLEYDQRNKLLSVNKETQSIIEDNKNHQECIEDLKNIKRDLKEEIRERCLIDADEVKGLEKTHEKDLIVIRDKLQSDLSILKGKCNSRLKDNVDDMELRRKLEVHDVEERKNLYLNELTKKHEGDIHRMKSYYQEITRDNLKEIKTLKDEISEKEKKADRVKQEIDDTNNENKRLGEPLTVAMVKVKKLRDATKNQEKDKMSLLNTKARLKETQKRLKHLTVEHHSLQQKFETTSKDRDEVYHKFDDSISEACEKNTCKNLLLEHRLQHLSRDNVIAEAQLTSVVEAASMDVSEANQISSALGDILREKNERIEKLRFAIAQAKIGYGDDLRRCKKKLLAAGISKEEVFILNDILTDQ